MTELSRETITNAHKLDGHKQFLSAVKEDRAIEVFSNDNTSAFVLYMAYLSVYGDEAMSFENEAIDAALSGYSEYNANRVKAISSILENDSYYVDVSAFGLAVEAVSCLELSADSVEPYDAGQIIMTLIVMAGIDGAVALPVKTSVIKFIKANLDHEGWVVPPLELMFKSIEDYYDSSSISEVASKFGKITGRKMYDLENLSGFGIERRSDLQNYMIKEQVTTIYVQDEMKKIHNEWAYLVSVG